MRSVGRVAGPRAVPPEPQGDAGIDAPGVASPIFGRAASSGAVAGTNTASTASITFVKGELVLAWIGQVTAAGDSTPAGATLGCLAWTKVVDKVRVATPDNGIYPRRLSLFAAVPESDVTCSVSIGFDPAPAVVHKDLYWSIEAYAGVDAAKPIRQHATAQADAFESFARVTLTEPVLGTGLTVGSALAGATMTPENGFVELAEVGGGSCGPGKAGMQSQMGAGRESRQKLVCAATGDTAHWIGIAVELQASAHR